MMEVKVANQQKGTVIKSELVSRTTAKIVNLDHSKEFQECMDSYEIGNWVHLFDMIWVLHFINALVMFVLLSQRVQDTIIGNIPANHTWDILSMFHFVVTTVVDCYT